jgi:hypothetical protein
VVVAGVEVGQKRKPPTSQRDSLGVVEAGVEVDGRKKPPNESTRLVGGLKQQLEFKKDKKKKRKLTMAQTTHVASFGPVLVVVHLPKPPSSRILTVNLRYNN